MSNIIAIFVIYSSTAVTFACSKRLHVISRLTLRHTTVTNAQCTLREKHRQFRESFRETVGLIWVNIDRCYFGL